MQKSKAFKIHKTILLQDENRRQNVISYVISNISSGMSAKLGLGIKLLRCSCALMLACQAIWLERFKKNTFRIIKNENYAKKWILCWCVKCKK